MVNAFAKRLGATLSAGAWLTRERIALVAAASLVFTIASLGFLAATSSGGVDILRRPLGTDFSSFYAAGTAALEGHPAAPYDPPQQHAMQRKLFGDDTPFYAFQYPPIFLLIITPLALLPFGIALLVWQLATLAAMLGVLRAIVVTRSSLAIDRVVWLAALALPSIFVNLGHGQNGFLSAALIGGGLLLLDRRPVMSGILFGLLAYKPQLGVMIPIALLAGDHWRAIIAAGVTVIALASASLAAFGWETFQAFLDSAAYTRQTLLEEGGPGWEKLQTVFAAIRLWGGSLPLAYAAQGVVTVAIAATVFWLWRRGPRPSANAAAALCIAAVLGTPFSLDYDMTLLAPAIAFILADRFESGFRPFEKTALALLWLAPMIARSVANATGIPLGVLAMGWMLALLVTAGRVRPEMPVERISA